MRVIATFCLFQTYLLLFGEGNGTPLQYSCLGNLMDGGAWWAVVHAVVKSRTRLSDFTFTFHFHTLEKEMATHSSVLPWRIPGTGEPGGLPSMGSHRVGHDWRYLAAAAAAVANSHPTAGNPMDYSTPSFPVLHHLPKLAQTYVHWFGDAIQPSNPLSPLSPPALWLTAALQFNHYNKNMQFSGIIFFKWKSSGSFQQVQSPETASGPIKTDPV